MGKLEKYEMGVEFVMILSKLSYRMECKLEELVFKMMEDIEGPLAHFEDIDFVNIKGFDISKKLEINNFLLTNAIIQPTITLVDLDNDEHNLTDKFREIGDYLFEKYIEQYSKKMSEKKKVLK